MISHDLTVAGALQRHLGSMRHAHDAFFLPASLRAELEDAELREMFERCEHAGKARGGGGAPTKATLCAVLEEAPVIRPDL